MVDWQPVYDAINDAEMLGEGFRFESSDYPLVFGKLYASNGQKMFLPARGKPEKIVKQIEDFVSRHRGGP